MTKDDIKAEVEEHADSFEVISAGDSLGFFYFEDANPTRMTKYEARRRATIFANLPNLLRPPQLIPE